MSADSYYEVLWPLGRARVDQVRPSDRPAGLSGKKVAFIWDYLFKGDQMFSIIAEHLSARFPGAEFVGYQEFGNIHGPDSEEKASLEALPARLAGYGADAVVVGVGA
jgi:hypothetical protein